MQDSVSLLIRNSGRLTLADELNLAVSFGISVFVYFEPPRILACLRRQGRFFARGMAHDEAI